jgi:hypothetical protein
MNMVNSRRNAKVIYGRPNMKRIVGEEFFIISGENGDVDEEEEEDDEEDDASSASETRSEPEEEAEVEQREAAVVPNTETEVDNTENVPSTSTESIVMEVEGGTHSSTTEKQNTAEREDLNDRPAKKAKVSYAADESNTQPTTSFMSKCIIL